MEVEYRMEGTYCPAAAWPKAWSEEGSKVFLVMSSVGMSLNRQTKDGGFFNCKTDNAERRQMRLL